MGYRRAAHATCIACALFASTLAIAATKVDEGFATQVRRDGRFLIPVDRIAEAIPGQDVFHWIQWKDHPVGHTTFRCRIVDDADGEVLLDETDTNEDSRPEGFSVCGWHSSAHDDPRSYTFSQYLNGEKVGELTVHFKTPSFWSTLGRYRQLKYLLGALALVIIAVSWLRKRAASRDEIEAAGRPEVVIGSKLAAAPTSPPPAPVTANDGGQALDAFRRKIAADPAFKPESAEDAFALAKAARKAGDAKLAVAALRGFDKVYPGHALIPEVYLFSAKLMADELGNNEMARKILAHLVQKYPGHFVAGEARKYLEALPA